MRIAHGKRAVNEVPEEIVGKAPRRVDQSPQNLDHGLRSPFKSFGVEGLYNDTSHYACGCARKQEVMLLLALITKC